MGKGLGSYLEGVSKLPPPGPRDPCQWRGCDQCRVGKSPNGVRTDFQIGNASQRPDPIRAVSSWCTGWTSN